MNWRQKCLLENDLPLEEGPDYDLLEQLSVLVFVVGDTVLGEDIRSIIFSLMQQFRHFSNRLQCHLEISQRYIVNKKISEESESYDNCEIVLKYVDDIVCATSAHERIYIGRDGNQLTDEKLVDCQLRSGSISFYIKQKMDDIYKYTLVRIVRLMPPDSPLPYYQNSDTVRKTNNVSSMAASQGQTYAILSSAAANKLPTSNVEDIISSIKVVNDIIDGTKNATTQLQLQKMSSQNVISTIPTQAAVDATQTVAKTLAEIPLYRKSGMIATLSPGNEPLIFPSARRTLPIHGAIAENGTEVDINFISSSQNTLNSRFADGRVTIIVDSCLMLVPIKNKDAWKDTIRPLSQELSVYCPIDDLYQRIPRPRMMRSQDTPGTMIMSNTKTIASLSHQSGLKHLESIIKNKWQIDLTGGVDPWLGQNIDPWHGERSTYATDTIERDASNRPIWVLSKAPKASGGQAFRFLLSR